MSSILRSTCVAATLLALATPAAPAQSPAQPLAQPLAQRVTSSNGDVDVIYPTRAGVCGDGRGSIRNIFGDAVQSGNIITTGHGGWDSRPCVAGPARVAVNVDDGQVTRLRVYVGPTPSQMSGTRTLNATAADAVAWLSGLVEHSEGRVPSEAIVSLLVADAPEPWPLLLRVARDDDRPRSTRRDALFWLGNGASAKLGLDGDRADSDEDEMRKQAVFVLSQRPKSESVPELIDLARTSKHPSVRRSAIFWLGQTGDPRAADVFADLLDVR